MWIKPIESDTMMRRGYLNDPFYYLAVVGNIKKLSARHKVPRPRYFSCRLSVGQGHQSPYWYTQKEIEKFPRYLRRGGKYGHDVVRLTDYGNVRPHSEYQCNKSYKHLCRVYGLKYVVIKDVI